MLSEIGIPAIVFLGGDHAADRRVARESSLPLLPARHPPLAGLSQGEDGCADSLCGATSPRGCGVPGSDERERGVDGYPAAVGAVVARDDDLCKGRSPRGHGVPGSNERKQGVHGYPAAVGTVPVKNERQNRP